MSERAAAAGSSGPVHTIEHEGRVYTVQPVLTERVMLAIETELYEREKRALGSQRDLMGEAAYNERLDELRKRYLDNEFAFESDTTMAYMKTKPGALMVLSAMIDCTKAELIALLIAKPVEVNNVLELVLALSMPTEKTPAAPEDAATAPKVVVRNLKRRRGR